MYKAGNSVEQVFGGSVIKQGDRTPLGFNFRDENGELVSLTNASVEIKIANEKAVVLEKAATLVDEYTASFSIGKDDITGSGDMRIEFTVTYQNGLQEKFPSDDWQRVKITQTLEDIGKTGIAYLTFEKMKADFNQKVDDLNKRVDKIVADAGNSNLEIVESRGNYDSLEDRLDASDNETSVLSNKLSGQVNITQYEYLVPNRNTLASRDLWDWTIAINTALAEYKYVELPAEKLKTSSTIVTREGNKLIGRGQGVSIIECTIPNIPILSAAGKFIHVSKLTLKRSNWTPSSDSNAVGIKLGAGNFVGQSKFTEIEIANCYEAIAADNTSNVYSCTISDIWIYAFRNWGIRLEPYGSTGCVVDNIYMTNWNDYSTKTKFTAKGGMLIKNYSEIDIRQLNVEHGVYEYALYAGDCDTVNVRTLHVEGYEQTQDYRAVVMSDNSLIDIDTLQVVYSSPNFSRTTFDPIGVTQWNLLGVNRGGRISARTLSNRNNYSVEKVGGGVTVVNTSYTDANNVRQNMINNCAYNADGAQTYRDSTKLKVEKHKNKDGKFTTFTSFVEQNGGRTHQIEEYDGKKYYQILSDGTVMNYFKRTIPTSGLWKTRDRLLNVSDAPNTYSDLKCTAGGYLSPPSSSVTATSAMAYTQTVIVNQVGSFVIGDRIIIAGSSRTFVITATANGGLTWTLDQNIEVQVTDASVQYATPLFKGIGLIQS